MTRTEIESFQFLNNQTVQDDWNLNAVKYYDAIMGDIKKTMLGTPKNDMNAMKEWQMQAIHAMARLSVIHTESQGWVDVSRSEHFVRIKEENPKANADHIEAIVRRAVSPPMFLLSCSIRFWKTFESSLTAVQSNLKSEKWQPT